MDEKNISQTPFLTLDPDLGQSAEAVPQTPETSGRAAAKTTDDLLSSMSDEEQQMVKMCIRDRHNIPHGLGLGKPQGTGGLGLALIYGQYAAPYDLGHIRCV